LEVVVLLWKCVFQHTDKEQNGMASDEPQYRRTDKTTALRKFLEQSGSYNIFHKTADKVLFYGGNKPQCSKAS